MYKIKNFVRGEHAYTKGFRYPYCLLYYIYGNGRGHVALY